MITILPTADSCWHARATDDRDKLHLLRRRRDACRRACGRCRYDHRIGLVRRGGCPTTPFESAVDADHARCYVLWADGRSYGSKLVAAVSLGQGTIDCAGSTPGTAWIIWPADSGRVREVQREVSGMRKHSRPFPHPTKRIASVGRHLASMRHGRHARQEPLESPVALSALLTYMPYARKDRLTRDVGGCNGRVRRKSNWREQPAPTSS